MNGLYRKIRDIIGASNPPQGPSSPPETEDDLSVEERVSRYWDNNIGRHMELFAHWESPGPIQSALNRICTGSPQLQPWVDFTARFGPFKTVAELGCGNGQLLAGLLLQEGVTVEGFDISPQSLSVCKDRVVETFGQADRCTFNRINLNNEPLPRDHFDAIYTTGTLHHVEHLDFCFESMRRALRPNGWLWLNDYVGPPRFQWSETQMRFADALLAEVPSRWRLRDSVFRTDPERLAEMDPSEAVCPDRIPAALSAHFEIVESRARGGTLLAPLFGSGCLSSEMMETAEGHAFLTALYESEHALIADGLIPSDHMLYIAKPRQDVEGITHRAMIARVGAPPAIADQGISGDLETWFALNLSAGRSSVRALDWVAPTPPAHMMRMTSGLERGEDFASHGVDIVRALAKVSPQPLNSYESILDFGVGVGRVARLFKGFKGRYTGVDVDASVIEWTGRNLGWVTAQTIAPRTPLPFDDGSFDCVISVSVFTHMCEADQLFYLSELRRVCRPGATLLITVSGQRVLSRACSEPEITDLIAVPAEGLEAARLNFESGSGFYFYRQSGHLTSDSYDYGITFISRRYIEAHWKDDFEILDIDEAAIHDFQDVVVLRARAPASN